MPTFGFSDDGVRRIVAAVRKSEQSTYGTVRGGGQQGGRDYPVPMQLAKLNATISGSCSGTAVLWGTTQASTAAPTSLGTSETVYDWFGGGGSSGDKVMLFRHYASGRLYFGSFHKKAPIIEFELTESLVDTDNAAAATVVSYDQGTDPDPSSDGITVVNPVTTTTGIYAFDGDSGTRGAAYLITEGADAGKYRILRMDEDPIVSSSSQCLTKIGDIDIDDIRIFSETYDTLEYVLGVTDDGCLVRVAVAECSTA